MPPRESSQRIRVTLYRSNGGLKYKGEMRQNLFDGWGEARYSNGNVYTGYWQLGKRHGYGDLKSVDSNGDVIRIYSGEWKNGKQCGLGTLECFINSKSNIVLEGIWKDNELNGWGRMRIEGGVLYEGGWVNGLRDGVGLLVQPSGDCFEGIWRNNVRQGPGRCWNPSNRSELSGVWVQDVFKSGEISVRKNFTKNIPNESKIS